MPDPVVSQLHRCLVDAVRRRGEDPLGAALKVADIYQELVPYREVREALGVDLNADYEHALLRLLAGEGGLVHLEPDYAREELQREAESSYPFVGLYRKFATADVWIEIDDVDAPEGAPFLSVVDGEQRPNPDEPVARTGPATPRKVTARATHGHAAPNRPEPVARRRGPRRVVARGVECAFCNQPLPVGRRVRHCPSCGSDQRLRPCPRCDEVLERTWRFCVNCGLEVPPVDFPRPPDPDE
ncbi:MAG: zinc ribbon domain-containing protein [Gemmatimonadota bacterium]|jgi:hypothetical protein